MHIWKQNIYPSQLDVDSIRETCAGQNPKTKTQHVTRKQNVDQLSVVDDVPTKKHSSQGESQLYIFEDNETVIKMIIKCRSPTMRHKSRTHRVALDWLFTSLTHYNLVHKFLPMPQAMIIPDAKAAVDKEWKKFETIPAWQLD